PQEHELRDSRMRGRDTEAALREAIHAIGALCDVGAQGYDGDCDDYTPLQTRSKRNDPELAWAGQVAGEWVTPVLGHVNRISDAVTATPFGAKSAVLPGHV